MINGISGKFKGFGEVVDTVQSRTPNAFSSLALTGCSGAAQGWATGLFAGAAGTGQVAQFWLFSSWPTIRIEATASTEGMYAAPVDYYTSPSAQSIVDLAPTNSTMCFFSEIAGQFDGGCEEVEIYSYVRPSDGVDWWRLRASACAPTASGGTVKSVRARARCYLRDQR
jgi:hypothetical protein